MKHLIRRMLALTLAVSMMAMTTVSSFAADSNDLTLQSVFGTSDEMEIAAQAVEDIVEEEFEQIAPAEEEPEEAAEPEESVEEPAEEPEAPDEEPAEEVKEPAEQPEAPEAPEEEPVEEVEEPAEEEQPHEAALKVKWLSIHNHYLTTAEYPYTGEEIHPEYQIYQSGEPVEMEKDWEGKFYADEECTIPAEDFVECGTIYFRLEVGGHVLAQSSYAIVPAPQELILEETAFEAPYNTKFYINAQAEGELRFASADETIAKVSRITGKVTVTGVGTTTITVTARKTDHYKKATAEVTVKAVRAEQTITAPVDGLEQKYNNGGTFQLEASTTGDSELTYTSSDEKVVTVSKTGKLTMKGVGVATITVTAPKTALYKKAEVKVPVSIYILAKRLSYSSSYKAHKYYKALMALKLTSGKRHNIVSIALSQLGYHEGKSSSQLGGNGTGDGNYTEYGRYYGFTCAPWCAMFVNWCARELGVSTGVIPKYAAVAYYHSFYRGKGRFYSWTKVRKKQYQPKIGDIIIYSNVKGGTAHHIGYVISATYTSSKVTITTVEGNTSDQVRKVVMKMSRGSSSGYVNSHYITGIAKPNY